MSAPCLECFLSVDRVLTVAGQSGRHCGGSQEGPDRTWSDAQILGAHCVLAEGVYARILEQGDPFPEARLRLINLNLKLNDPARALQVALDGPPAKSFIDSALRICADTTLGRSI